MKKPKNSERRSSKRAVIFIVAIFVAIVVAGLFLEFHERNSQDATAEKIAVAREVVAAALNASGDDIAGYQFVPGKRVREGDLLQVTFCGGPTTHVYLVNLTSRAVLVHSRTDVADNASGIGRYLEPNACR